MIYFCKQQCIKNNNNILSLIDIMRNKKKALHKKYNTDDVEDDIKDILKYYIDKIDDIHNDVSKLQKRK